MLVLDAKDSPVIVRHRIFDKTRAEAESDRLHLTTQRAAAGVGTFLVDRKAIHEY